MTVFSEVENHALRGNIFGLGWQKIDSKMARFSWERIEPLRPTFYKHQMLTSNIKDKYSFKQRDLIHFNKKPAILHVGRNGRGSKKVN